MVSSADEKLRLRRIIDSYRSQFHLHKSKFVFCRQCAARVKVGAFAEHLHAKHALSCATACPFCYAEFRWQRGDLSRQVSVAQHRPQCLKKFLKTHRKAPRIVSPSDMSTTTTTPVYEEGPAPLARRRLTGSIYTGPFPVAYSFCPTCYEHHKNGAPPQHMDGRANHSSEWGASFYEPFPEDPLFFRDCGPSHVRFSEKSGLGLCAHNIFQCFLSDEYAFYHIMVRARVWGDFCSRDWGRVHFLPYSTLCDGSHDAAAREEETAAADEGRVHHRHMIVAMKRECVQLFKKQWKTIVDPAPPPPPRVVDTGGKVRRRPRSKLCIAIESARHLMHALAYVSRPRASCDGYGNEGACSGSHYWIFRELSPCALLAMAALWPQGHAALVSERHRESDLYAYFYHVERRGERENGEAAWQVQLAYLKMREDKCVLPLAKGYEMCADDDDDTTGGIGGRPVVYFYGRARTLRSAPRLEALSHDAWLRHQIETGNTFWECVSQEYYVLEHHQKRTMNAMHRLDEERRNWHAREKLEWQSDAERLKREVNQHAEATATALRELAESQGYVRTAQRELTEAQKRIQQLEQEVRGLRDKCEAHLEARLRQTEERLQQTEERLRQSEEQNKEYRKKIDTLDEALKGANEASQRERIQRLEGALQAVTKLYRDVTGQDSEEN